MNIEQTIIEARARVAAAEEAVNVAVASGKALAIREANEELNAAKDILREWEREVFVPSDDAYRTWQNLLAIYGRFNAMISERRGLYATAKKKNQVKAMARHMYDIAMLTPMASFYADMAGEAEAFYRAEEERKLNERAAATQAKRAAFYAEESVAA